MNKDILQGEWTQIKGKIKEKWGKLTDNDLTEINGKKEQLLGKLEKAYGYTKDRALQELNEWEKKINSSYSSSSQFSSSQQSKSDRDTTKPFKPTFKS